MISGNDFYKVMCAMVPLYFAMLVAYSSVKWWKIFSPEQCSGINRFVAVFAVPVLSFHFISQNNPYQMDTKFILADTLSKVGVLVLLSVWAIFFNGGLDWLITLFSVATLPNTLVMGIPLLKAMYGDFTQSLMVQVVVLQCIIWYTLLLFLFEYRAATLLIQTQFPGATAASISKFELDNDVISLDGRDPLRTESELDANGRTIRVRIRRSTSSATDMSPSIGITPRASNLSNAEIFSVNTPAPLIPHDVAFGHADLALGYRSGSPRLSGYVSSDAYSLQPSPRASNFNELETTTGSTPVWSRSPVAGRVFRQTSPAFSGVTMMWESPVLCAQGDRQGFKDVTVTGKEISFRDCTKIQMPEEADNNGAAPTTTQEMPHAFVMMRLILVVVGRKLSRNPNTYSSVLGLLWSLISFKWNVGMPSLVKYSIKIISDAGLGMAMFSLGLFMALQPRIIACGTKRATMGMAIRFLCGPIIMSATSVAVGLRGVKLHFAIVQAALPQGIVPFVFAREYGLHPDILSTGVIFGMLVSLPVTLLYYIFLGL
ncbi:auxin efflux carrier component 6-like isoform X1 [Juglans microcarpa x Juglans regia]|uniref:auxin efflux carrier component 6-like isoform X1 n=1 Tax=Juglans microcarpa x Juglans regia TaxID=2249226 RepID=UPI001B7E5547|nr:auxin efflux carrier component 6-like isoform X1 [Juglans microcarpa x Juglans regia]